MPGRADSREELTLLRLFTDDSARHGDSNLSVVCNFLRWYQYSTEIRKLEQMEPKSKYSKCRTVNYPRTTHEFIHDTLFAEGHGISRYTMICNVYLTLDAVVAETSVKFPLLSNKLKYRTFFFISENQF